MKSALSHDGGMHAAGRPSATCLLKLQSACGVRLGVLPGLGTWRRGLASSSSRLPPVHHLDGSLRGKAKGMLVTR